MLVAGSIDVVRMVNEPTAAALAMACRNASMARLSSTTLAAERFDCSILQLQDDVFKVLSTHGDTHLGAMISTSD